MFSLLLILLGLMGLYYFDSGSLPGNTPEIIKTGVQSGQDVVACGVDSIWTHITSWYVKLFSSIPVVPSTSLPTPPTENVLGVTFGITPPETSSMLGPYPDKHNYFRLPGEVPEVFHDILNAGNTLSPSSSVGSVTPTIASTSKLTNTQLITSVPLPDNPLSGPKWSGLLLIYKVTKNSLKKRRKSPLITRKNY
jgi:hypothetical protein